MDKPFKTIQEQVSILESRGMRTDEATPLILKREGYYSVVNGYKTLFLSESEADGAKEDRYTDGTTFESVYRLFTFDRDLRMTMSRYFAQAEATLKTVCAYRFSERHSQESEPYLNPGNYRSDGAYPKRVEDLIEDFKRVLHKPPYDKGAFKREYIEHYVKRHDETPLWVLTNFLMLGQIFKFYEYQPESMRNSIAKGFAELYGETHGTKVRISPKRLRLIYDHVKDFRNICAHDERLYCARVSPSRDVTFADLLGDLAMVLTKEENARMQGEVIHLLHEMMTDLGIEVAAPVLKAMGVESLDETFLSFNER